MLRLWGTSKLTHKYSPHLCHAAKAGVLQGVRRREEVPALVHHTALLLHFVGSSCFKASEQFHCPSYELMLVGSSCLPLLLHLCCMLLLLAWMCLHMEEVGHEPASSTSTF